MRYFALPRIALVTLLVGAVGVTSACYPTSRSQPPVFPETAQADPSLSPQKDNSTASQAVVKSLRANLRDKPSRSGAIVMEVSRGEHLALVNSMPVGAWYRVRQSTTNTDGWIHGNVIALTHPSLTTAPTPERTTRSRLSAPSTQRSSGRSYVNVDGDRIPSPVFSDRRPAGATARCRDGSYSFSQNRRGTCSHHGGVAEWLR